MVASATMGEMTLVNVVVGGVRSPVRQSMPAGSQEVQEAVVFVHGNPGSSEDWSALLPQVGEFARAIAPDMPGYGRADRPAGFDYTVPGYAAHLAGVLEQLGVARVHLVLHDFGGLWGLHFAAEHPERIASITLFNIGAMPGYRWHRFARIWRTPILGEIFQLTATRAAFGMLLNRDNPRPFPDEFIDRMHRDADWPMKRAVLKLYRATDDPGGDVVELAQRIKAECDPPTLVLWGDGDSYLPVAYAQRQTEFFDAAVHVLAECGHWPMIDDPERVSALVLPFLRTQVLGAPNHGESQ